MHEQVHLCGLRSLNVKRYYLGEAFNHVYLTAREMEFIRWMAQGKTAWEIAKIMGISARTVEVHSENIKRKLDCVKLQQVIWKLIKENRAFWTDDFVSGSSDTIKLMLTLNHLLLRDYWNTLREVADGNADRTELPSIEERLIMSKTDDESG